MKPIQLTITLIICICSYVNAQKTSERQIYMDIAHGQKFWNDPDDMKGMDENQVNRVKYMTGEFLRNAGRLNADLNYIKDEITQSQLNNCDLLFIHIPSAQYNPKEIETIAEYLEEGGSLFLVMDVDYWSTLEQTNVNDMIIPYGVQFGGNSPDTLSGGYTRTNAITQKPLKITYHGGRIVKGGTPFCFNNQTEAYPFGTFMELKGGGKLVVMGDGMVSLYMTSWNSVDGYQCHDFMHDVFKWLLE